MLDILMPVSVSRIPDVLSTVEDIKKNTDVPFRLVVCVDGGTRDDIRELESGLMAAEREWVLRQNSGVQGLPNTLDSLVESVRNEFIAVIPCGTRILDAAWFGKMQMPFTKDPHCFMVAADVPHTQASSAPPFRLDHKTHPKSGFFLTRKNPLQNIVTFTDSEDFSTKALRLGGTRWIASGVRYGETEIADKNNRTVESNQGSDSGRLGSDLFG